MKRHVFRRLRFAHSYLFAGFPPYQVACFVVPVALLLAIPGLVYVLSSTQECEHFSGGVGTIAACTRLIKAGGQPDDLADDYFYRGLAYADADQYPLAVTDFTSALKYDPTDADTLNGRMIAEEHTGDIAGAIRDGIAALALSPGNAVILEPLGTAYLMNKQFDQAIEMESAAITNSSPDTYSLRIRAEAYLSEDDYEPAIQDLDAVLKLAPSLEEGYQLRGKGEFGLKEYGASVTDEDAALKLNPKDKKAQTILQQAQAAE